MKIVFGVAFNLREFIKKKNTAYHAEFVGFRNKQHLANIQEESDCQTLLR